MTKIAEQRTHTFGRKTFAKTAHMGISSWKTTERRHEIVQFCSYIPKTFGFEKFTLQTAM